MVYLDVLAKDCFANRQVLTNFLRVIYTALLNCCRFIELYVL